MVKGSQRKGFGFTIALLLTLVLSGAVSANTAVKLVCTSYPTKLAADGTSFVQVTAQVSNGIGDVVPGTTDHVTFAFSGDALGCSFHPPTPSVYAIDGMARINVIAGTQQGTITITATASGLMSGQVEIELVKPSQYSDPNFPVGAFDSANTWAMDGRMYIVEDKLDDMLAHNLDSVMLHGCYFPNENILYAADSRNMGLYLNKGFGSGTPEDITSQNEANNFVQEVTDLSWHPSFRAYYMADEPGWGDRDGLKYLHTAASNQMPTLPACSLQLGLGSYRAADLFEYVGDDALLLDIYPFYSLDSIGDLNMTGFGYSGHSFVDYIREIAQVKPAGYPLWTVLQAHKFLDPGEPYSLRYPEPEEIRVQQWLAVGEGSTGVWWFVYSNLNGPNDGLGFSEPEMSDIYDEIGSCAGRLAGFKELLLDVQKVPDEFTATATGSVEPYVSTLGNDTMDTYYVVAVNLDCVNSQDLTIGTDFFSCQIKDLETDTLYSLDQPITFAAGDGKVFEVVGDRHVLPPPTDLRPTVESLTQINLDWTDTTNNEDGFRICRKTGSAGAWQEVDTVPANQNWYHDTNRSQNTTYHYHVQAFNTEGNSQFSNTVDIAIINTTPTHLVLESAPDMIEGNGLTRSTVTARVCDSSGQTVTMADNLISFDLSGDGALDGTTPVNAESGIAQIDVVSPMYPGTAIVSGSASGLTGDDAEVTFIQLPNLLQNPSFEIDNGSGHPEYWGGPYGSNSGAYITTDAHVGSACWAGTGGSADAYLDQHEYSSLPNVDYALSAWVKLDNVTGGDGGFIRYVSWLTGGSTPTWSSDWFTGDSGGEWSFVSVEFTTPSDHDNHGRVDLLWNHSSGTLYYDDISLSAPDFEDTEPPSKPTNLVVDEAGSSTIALSWTEATDNIAVSGYRVFRNGSLHGSTTETTYTATGLIPNNAYTFTVTAFDLQPNESEHSDPVVTATGSLSPDLNDNGYVDEPDIRIMAGAWLGTGAIGSQGDINGDNVCDSLDFLLLCQAWTGSPPPLPNLVRNGSFEEDLDSNNWPDDWGHPWCPDCGIYAEWDTSGYNAHSGSRSYKVLGGSGEDIYAQQDNIGLQPSTSYEMSVWVKGTGTGEIKVRAVEVNSGTTYDTTASLPADWTQQVKSFTTRSDITSDRVDLQWHNLDAGGTGWFDDVVINEVE